MLKRLMLLHFVPLNLYTQVERLSISLKAQNVITLNTLPAGTERFSPAKMTVITEDMSVGITHTKIIIAYT